MSSARTAIIIPSKGRPEVLAQTIASVSSQTLLPDQVIISVSCLDDLPPDLPIRSTYEVVIGPPGSCAQRNRARSHVRRDTDIVFLLDDDIELADNYIESILRIMREHPEVGLIGGNVLAENVSRAEAKLILAARPTSEAHEVLPARALYGCNMCVRTSILQNVDFDENLRLVGWLEDFDWSVRAGEFGAIRYAPSACVVHLRVNSGRVSGEKFGYAQVINPLYLHLKGSIPTLQEVLRRHWLRLIPGNIVGLIRGDSHIDRWGRLRGNLRAFGDLLCGRIDPNRIDKPGRARKRGDER